MGLLPSIWWCIRKNPRGRHKVQESNHMIGKRYLLLAVFFCLSAFFAAAGCGSSDSSRDQDLRLISYNLTDWSKNWRVIKPSASGPGHKASVRFKNIGDAPDVVAIFDGDPEVPGVLQSVPLPARQGADYRLSFDLFRSRFQNGHYLSVNLFGREFYLNNHCVAGGWQKFMVQAHIGAGFSSRVVFRNDTDSGFLLRRPALELVHQSLNPAASPEPALEPRDYDFPLGTYGAGPAQLPELNACGLNAAFMSAKASQVKDLLAKAQAQGVRLILSCPLDVKNIKELAKPLAGIKPDQRPIFFYLQDEPEIRSTPLEKLLEARRTLQKALPWARTATAMVRPWLVPQYNPAYDAIFMDQYPVPTQPMNWLADSIRQARRLSRHGTQIWGVIQAFGGGKHADMGWPRLPTAAEMGALAGEALAEGAQGLLFYTWDAKKQNPEHQKNVCSLVLLQPNYVKN